MTYEQTDIEKREREGGQRETTEKDKESDTGTEKGKERD